MAGRRAGRGPRPDEDAARRQPADHRRFPFPIAVEILPAHLPLPAKIRTEILDPIEVDTDPGRAGDTAYVQKIYDEVESVIQAGMDRLAARRTLPVLG